MRGWPADQSDTCYYLPLIYGHSSFSSIRKQLAKDKEPGDAIHDPTAQLQAVNLALQGLML